MLPIDQGSERSKPLCINQPLAKQAFWVQFNVEGPHHTRSPCAFGTGSSCMTHLKVPALPQSRSRSCIAEAWPHEAAPWLEVPQGALCPLLSLKHGQTLYCLPASILKLVHHTDASNAYMQGMSLTWHQILRMTGQTLLR